MALVRKDKKKSVEGGFLGVARVVSKGERRYRVVPQGGGKMGRHNGTYSGGNMSF